MSVSDFDTTETEGPMFCAKHPSEQTYLRCNRCERPICAKCRVRTPVGFRCYECAGVQVLPTYAVDTSIYIRAAAAGSAAAGVIGVLMGFFPAWEFWAALVMGIAVPEAVAFASNQKRGPGLQYVGIGSLVFGFAVSRLVMETFGIFARPSFIPLLDSMPFHVTQYTILWLALAIFLTYKRLQ